MCSARISPNEKVSLNLPPQESTLNCIIRFHSTYMQQSWSQMLSSTLTLKLLYPFKDTVDLLQAEFTLFHHPNLFSVLPRQIFTNSHQHYCTLFRVSWIDWSPHPMTKSNCIMWEGPTPRDLVSTKREVSVAIMSSNTSADSLPHTSSLSCPKWNLKTNQLIIITYCWT